MSTIPPPHPALRAVVVVPARDEEALIGRCVGALAVQEGVDPDAYEVLVVLDRCTDGTRERAHEARRAHPALRLHVRESPGPGVGATRRAGLELACARLHALDRPAGLLATTDADSVVAPTWLAAQLAALAAGAQAVGGRIELDPAEAALLPTAVLDRRRRFAAARRAALLASRPAQPDGAGGDACEHHQFSGASIGVTAEVYAKVGGIRPREALEDEAFERALAGHRVPILRTSAVRVKTSARLAGRAPRGLACDLRLAVRLAAAAGRSTSP